MDKKEINFKDHEEILKDLDNLAEKLHLITDFYNELELVRQKRKHLVENLVLKIDKTKSLQKRTFLMKKVTFGNSFQSNAPKSESVSEENKSISHIFGLLENLSIKHKEVNRKINDEQFLRSQSISDPDKNMELDEVISKLQEEKNEINNKIVQFVITNVVDTKMDFIVVITNLEDENNLLQDKINCLERTNDYLKDTITALMLENQLMNKGERRLSDAFRKSILERRASLALPVSLRSQKISDLSEDDYFENTQESDILPEQTDILSVPRSTLDSFTLDAAIATWAIDQESLYDQVRRIGKDLEMMEVNQMKIDLLRRYVRKHGAKYIQWENPHIPMFLNHIPF